MKDKEEESEMSWRDFNVLLTRKMQEHGIPSYTTFDHTRAEVRRNIANGKTREERSLNNWLDRKARHDWERAPDGREPSGDDFS